MSDHTPFTEEELVELERIVRWMEKSDERWGTFSVKAQYRFITEIRRLMEENRRLKEKVSEVKVITREPFAIEYDPEE